MNTLPHITVIMLAYGRVELLEEAIASFLAQDYQGTKELIVYNTFLDQHLAIDPMLGVNLLNAKRLSTLGATRNAAIEHAKEGLIVICDDDDLILPNHLSNFAKGWQEGFGWVRHDHQFYMEARKIKSLTEGMMNTFAFTKAAWRAVGGYSEVNVGEDRQICGAITSQFAGMSVQLQASEASYLYSWDDEQFHISGKGEEGNSTALQRVEAHVKERVGAMFIPTGVITLNPRLKQDYVKMAAEFSRGIAAFKVSAKGKVGLVLLGRYGDILNILPVAKYINDHYAKPHFFVAREFADVLDGVSYVIPEVLDLSYDQIHPALAIADKKCELVINAQIWGDKFVHSRDFGSYNFCSWMNAGFADAFHDPHNFPLVLDRRDYSREDTLREVTRSTRPVILCNLSGGHSSPFPHAGALWDQLYARHLLGFKLVDISKIKAERIYDLLGLMDHAELLITSDTATLHLATASSIPVIALVNDRDCGNGVKWLATEPRCNVAMKLGYSEVMANADRIHEDIGHTENLLRRVIPEHPRGVILCQRRIFHAVSMHPRLTAIRDERKMRAQKTWEALYKNSGVIPAHDGSDHNATDIGDARELPYLKDVLSNAMAKAEDNDIIFWTNDDNVLHPDLPAMLRMFIAIYGVCTSFRCDFEPGQMPRMDASPKDIALKAPPHMGRDLFAATKLWMKAHWDEIPNAILGAPMFDLHLAAIVRNDKGYGTTRQNVEKLIPCCDIPKGYIMHEIHPSRWSELPPSTPSHRHNSRLFQEWARVNCPELHFHEDGQI